MWNPFKGGTYDWSQGLKAAARYSPIGAAYTAITDPDYYKRAATNVANRYSAGGGAKSFLPSSLWHIPKAKAQTTDYANRGAYTAAPSVSGASTSGSYSAGGSGTSTQPNIAWWYGKSYNLSNPNEAAAYADARRGFINEQFDYGAQQGRRQLDQQMGQYGEDLMSTLQGLGKAKESRDVGIARYFSAIAPSMYQSAEGENLRESQETYQEGQDEANRQTELNKGNLTNWWSDYLRNSAIQKQQELDQINEALSQGGDQSVIDRIKGSATATPLSYNKVDVGSYFDKLGQSIGQIPQRKTSQLGQRTRTDLVAALKKQSSGKALNAKERALLQEYGI